MSDCIFTQIYQLFLIPTQLHHIGIIAYHIYITVAKSNASTFRHPVLSDSEHAEGYKLGIDSWADTCCADKHEFVEEFIEGKTVTATGFISSLGSVSNVSIANVVYAYDASDGTVLFLDVITRSIFVRKFPIHF